MNVPSMCEFYFEYSVPVESLQDLATPSGLYHMFSNVREFVESIVPTQGPVLKGGDWRSSTANDLSRVTVAPTGDSGVPFAFAKTHS